MFTQEEFFLSYIFSNKSERIYSYTSSQHVTQLGSFESFSWALLPANSGSRSHDDSFRLSVLSALAELFLLQILSPFYPTHAIDKRFKCNENDHLKNMQKCLILESLVRSHFVHHYTRGWLVLLTLNCFIHTFVINMNDISVKIIALIFSVVFLKRWIKFFLKLYPMYADKNIASKSII